jgi:hypothetical protein
MSDTAGEVRSKEKLQKYIRNEITKIFSSVLDYAEVAVDGKERYTNFRSKVLKISNDSIRDIERELALRYTVNYIPPAEDVVVVKQQKK